eukprot:1595956-Pleurochrysis_carterae.AAC.3
MPSEQARIEACGGYVRPAIEDEDGEARARKSKRGRSRARHAARGARMPSAESRWLHAASHSRELRAIAHVALA